MQPAQPAAAETSEPDRPSENSNDKAADRQGWDLPEWSPDTFSLSEELKSNPKLKREDIEQLHEWAQRQSSVPALREGDLVKFLHSNQYDVHDARKCMNHYFTTRAETGELFHDRDLRLDKLQAVLKVMDFVVCPRLAPDGSRIIVNGLKDPDPHNYVFADHQKVMLMMMDAMVMAEPTLPGIYIIYDLSLGKIGHFWKFGLFLQRKLFAYLQAGLPARLNRVILLHTPSYINKVMKVLKTLGDRKRLEETRMFEGDDFTELHKVLPKECLPSDYGGMLPSRSELHDLTCQRLVALRDLFRGEEEALKA